MILEAFDIWSFIAQSPIIPLVISTIILIIILVQCFMKHIFYKARFIISFAMVFIAALLFVFYDKIKESSSDNPLWLNVTNIAFISLELISLITLFVTVDFTLSNEKISKELTNSLNETKYYVLLDKKDRVKEMSKLLEKDLDYSDGTYYKKNIFDVIEKKYRIIGMNDEEAYKADLKKFFNHYGDKVEEGKVNKLIINLEDDNAVHSAMYFNETTIFINGKYKGRILIGDKKDKNSLLGVESELAEVKENLDLISERFIVVLNNSSDGIFFNTLSLKQIWFNDVLVKKLNLNGNSMSSNEFYKNIAPENLSLYQEQMTKLSNDEYNITYKYNTGGGYVYIKEVGKKIVTDNVVELCGIMHVFGDFGYQKTDSPLDQVGDEMKMKLQLKKLINEGKTFEVVYFKCESIPDINQAYGRAIGNEMLSQYVKVIHENFVSDDMIYRVSGLEFVAFITNYNRMEALKAGLNNEERLLHVSATFGDRKIVSEVKMGISFTNDTMNPADVIQNAYQALKIASNEQYAASFAYYKDIK